MIRFEVLGQPATKGSARAFVVRRGGGPPRAIITNDAGEKAKTWAAVVGDAARKAMGTARPFDGPIRVAVTFHLPRPQAHFNSKGALKPNAPTHVDRKPDGDKLERCTWDALTGIVFTDDARIASWTGEKRYSDDGRTGATVEVEAIAAAAARPSVSRQLSLATAAGTHVPEDLR